MKDNRYKDYTHFFCVCCSKAITTIFDGVEEYRPEYKLESGMYSDAIVDSVVAGYGSIHDGNSYYVAICDECTGKALDDGRLAYKFNYTGSKPSKEELDRWDNGYKQRMRDNNIKNLLK